MSSTSLFQISGVVQHTAPHDHRRDHSPLMRTVQVQRLVWARNDTQAREIFINHYSAQHQHTQLTFNIDALQALGEP